MNRTGFSLLELIAVMAIMGTLFAIVSLNFSSWQKKSLIENRTREIYGDLNDARLNSVYLKKRHSLVFQPNGYVMKRYSSEDESRTAGTVVLSRSSTYLLTKKDGASIADRIFEFNIRGFTDDLDTIYVNPVASGAMFDCIVISDARTNMGQGVDSDSNGQPNSCSFK